MGNAAEAPPGRLPTRWEIGVDAGIHALAIIAGSAGAIALLLIAIPIGAVALVVAAVYSVSLVAMFSCSAAYNLNRWSRHRSWLRSLDQAAIFLMIAGSYTPFTVLHLEGGWRVAMTAAVWLLAGLGVALRLQNGRLFDRISVLLYLALGWLGLVALAPLVQAVDALTLALLIGGGLLYTAGVVFHLWERLPFQNAIWHGFVLAAASLHFAAVAGSLSS